jgi:hypothetical protein
MAKKEGMDPRPGHAAYHAAPRASFANALRWTVAALLMFAWFLIAAAAQLLLDPAPTD